MPIPSGEAEVGSCCGSRYLIWRMSQASMNSQIVKERKRCKFIPYLAVVLLEFGLEIWGIALDLGLRLLDQQWELCNFGLKTSDQNSHECQALKQIARAKRLGWALEVLVKVGLD